MCPDGAAMCPDGHENGAPTVIGEGTIFVTPGLEPGYSFSTVNYVTGLYFTHRLHKAVNCGNGFLSV